MHPVRFLLLGLLSSVLLLHSCSSIKPVEYRWVDQLEFKNPATLPEFSATVHFYNPNTLGVKLKNFNLEFYLSGVQLVVLRLNDPSRIPARQEFSLPVSGVTSVSQLVQFVPKGINSYLLGEKLPVVLTGSITMKKFIFKKTIPFHYEDNVDSRSIVLH